MIMADKVLLLMAFIEILSTGKIFTQDDCGFCNKILFN